MSAGLNDKLLWALTPEAEHTINEMVSAGFDRDLALSILEQLWKEDAIYSLPEKEDG